MEVERQQLKWGRFDSYKNLLSLLFNFVQTYKYFNYLICLIEQLRINFTKLKGEFIAKRDEAYKSLKRKIKNDLNEGKVYDEIAKVKALLSRQINELKALCKTEFNSRQKSDNEILIAIEKWSLLFSEKAPQIIE